MAEETVDELGGYGLRLIQPADGYRFSLDPLLLADFARQRDGAKVIDLGTGSGIIPMLMARRSESSSFVGVEMQEEMALLAERNVALNGLCPRVEIVCADILEIRKDYPVSSFDTVVANPPYRRQGTGKTSPRKGRDRARHESTATMADFLDVAKYLVRPNGSIYFIYHPLRLSEFCAVATGLKLTLLRMRMVHGYAGASARMVLLELAKGRGGELEVVYPMIIHGEDGDYSNEVKSILRVPSPQRSC